MGCLTFFSFYPIFLHRFQDRLDLTASTNAFLLADENRIHKLNPHEKLTEEFTQEAIV
jgi:hypothetical protein